jgi:hypothetical protein
VKKSIKNRERQIAAIAAKREAQINLSDMPEVLDWSGAEIGKFYRPSNRLTRTAVVVQPAVIDPSHD